MTEYRKHADNMAVVVKRGMAQDLEKKVRELIANIPKDTDQLLHEVGIHVTDPDMQLCLLYLIEGARGRKPPIWDDRDFQVLYRVIMASQMAQNVLRLRDPVTTPAFQLGPDGRKTKAKKYNWGALPDEIQDDDEAGEPDGGDEE